LTRGRSPTLADTAFKQQTLKAWRPILSPRVAIATFCLVGAVFIPVGVAIALLADQVRHSSAAGAVASPSVQPAADPQCSADVPLVQPLCN